MYKLLVAYIFCILCSACSKPALPWAHSEIKLNTNSDLNSVLYITDNIGFAMGGDRYTKKEIFKTTDGGKTWQQYADAEPYQKAILDSKLLSNGNIIASGISGYTMRSADTGKTWQFKLVPSYVNIESICENASNIWFCGSYNSGGHVSHSDLIFENVATQNITSQLNAIIFTSKTIGYASGTGAILKTTDAGQTWQYTPAKNDVYTHLIATNDATIFACGLNGNIIYTKNGGTEWLGLKDGNDLVSNNRFNKMALARNNTIYAVGDAGLVLKINIAETPVSYTILNINTSKNLYSISTKNDNTMAVVGEQGSYFEFAY
jgi:photosystem II stability/assembly factor-like uncharacterized protein